MRCYSWALDYVCVLVVHCSRWADPFRCLRRVLHELRPKSDHVVAMATASAGGRRGGGAKAAVAEQIAQAVQSTSNLLQLMEESSPAQVHLAKLPKNLMAKSSLAKNTEQVLHQLPHIISSLDAYMESSLQSASQIKTVTQVLSNMESTQLRSIVPSSELKNSG